MRIVQRVGIHLRAYLPPSRLRTELARGPVQEGAVVGGWEGLGGGGRGGGATEREGQEAAARDAGARRRRVACGAYSCEILYRSGGGGGGGGLLWGDRGAVCR